jgi:hypothetical protein
MQTGQPVPDWPGHYRDILTDQLWQRLRAAVTATMRVTGEDPADERLLGLRCQQVTSQLSIRAGRARETWRQPPDATPDYGHEIVPLPGSLRDQDGPRGEPVTSGRLSGYEHWPLTALCSTCHQAVRRACPEGPWEHEEE